MPPKAPHTHHILEGEAILYKRTGTPHWQVRYKIGSKWLRGTTKQDKLADAKKAAVDLILNAKFREKNDLPVINKRFKSVANLAIKRMTDLNEAGQGKATFKQYIYAINKYLIPYFGKYNIDKIDHPLISRFAVWRIEEMKKSPSQSAINTHNSALNRVFDEALLRSYITQVQVPHLENKGASSDRRPTFTEAEYDALVLAMRTWVKEARKGYETQARNILRSYVLILANTGIRAGTEAMNLKWKHLFYDTINDKQTLTFAVKGKTKKERRIQVKTMVARYLQRIQQKDVELKGLTFDEVIAKQVDRYVFRIDDRDMTTQYGRMFKRLLESAQLLVDPITANERTLYSLRHYYATRMLTKGHVSHYQLSQYMGTSVGMIEKHYGHLRLRELAQKFVGEGEIQTELKYGKNDKRPDAIALAEEDEDGEDD